MRETENERRFKRDMTLNRVCRHLAQRCDAALPMREYKAIVDAYRLVVNLQASVLEEELQGIGLK
jgi:hypothetical protein